jgi:hypothetical protein
MMMELMVEDGTEVVNVFHTSVITSKRIVVTRVTHIIRYNLATSSNMMMTQFTLHFAIRTHTLISSMI